MAYGAVAGALLHSAGLERVKAAPMYILSFLAGGLVIPILLYFTWGSTSPLTNRGTHDFIGVFSLYIFLGVWGLILAWRAGPRLGAFEPHSKTIGPIPHNLGLSAAGVGILLFAAPFAFLGCGYLVPGSGYFGISLTTSGFGIVVLNIFMAYIGGILAGALISYKTKNPIMILLGPVAGYIGAGASLDIAKPWEILLIAAGGAFVVYWTYLLMYRIRIDEKKIVPLALGGGIYGALIAGIVGWGDKTGGYFGLTGVYAPQHATINLGWQALGVLVTVVIAGVSGLIFIILLEKTIGLRVSPKVEIAGLDESYWQAPPSPYLDAPSEGPEEAPIPGETHAGVLPGQEVWRQ
jgi:ammonia channel protein AmtB